jgi:hypothetical protein
MNNAYNFNLYYIEVPLKAGLIVHVYTSTWVLQVPTNQMTFMKVVMKNIYAI